MTNIIEVSHLKKAFGTVQAVSDLSFTVTEGEFFAFLGENGAGKSTTISILCGILKKDEGEIRICQGAADEDNGAVKGQIGVVFQNSVLDFSLSAYDNLRYRAALYGLMGKKFQKRLKELDDRLSFGEFLHRPVGKLSGGQRRRIDIARALLSSPKVLILDEPTTGLDPQTRKIIWSVVDHLRKDQKMTVFLTTHYMEEAAESDHVLILERGKIAAFGTPLELKSRYASDLIYLYGVTEEQAKSLGYPVEAIPDGYCIKVPDPSHAARLIGENQELFANFEVSKGKMDDVFLAVTGRTLKGEEEC